jgi:DNA topoisomerase-6 subunit B
MSEKFNDANDLAKNLKEISVAEFFEKNRHLLGYENTTKAMLTVIKELVDNSIDACEEAGILPDINVKVKDAGENRYLIKVEDNGPGIVEEKISLAFGKLLYGSKFQASKRNPRNRSLRSNNVFPADNWKACENSFQHGKGYTGNGNDN